MAKGRARIPFSSGSLSIHSVSAAAVESVSLGKGDIKPVAVAVQLSNAAGLFQVDQLLRNKLEGSGLEGYLEFDVTVGEEEKRILNNFSF
jgi:metal-dependent HD superfamily phosphatase/phosphodiesterase